MSMGLNSNLGFLQLPHDIMPGDANDVEWLAYRYHSSGADVLNGTL